jgi:prepilin-type N-terminal cleavage/methylation domain-containing protein
MRPAPERDAGFSLTELLIVIVLTGIIGSIVLTVVTTGLHQQTKVEDRNDSLAQARTALQRIDRDVRSANPLTAACPDGTRLSMTEVGTTTTGVTYSVIQQSATRYELVADQVSVDSCDAPLTPTSRTVLLTNLVNTASSPVFAYADGMVIVSVQVQPPSLTQPVVLSDGGVELRNLS